MKRVAAVINVAALFLFLGMFAPAYAQDQGDHPKADQQQQKSADQKQQEHARKDQEKAQKEAQKQQKHEQKQQEKQAKDQQQRQQKQAREQQKQQAKQAKEENKRERHNQMAQNNDHPNQDNRADRHDNNHDHGQMEARNHERIPEDRYREHFGREHEFHVHRVVEVEGHPRFQYSGYWFELVNPWPVEWSYDDDCYIDYMNGEYWLFDPVHPGVQIEVFVVG